MRSGAIRFSKEKLSIVILYKGNTILVYAVCNLLSNSLVALTNAQTPFSYVTNSQDWLCTILNTMFKCLINNVTIMGYLYLYLMSE